MLVFDATPLIYLATVDRLSVATARPDECLVPTAVYEEVVDTGLTDGHADARRIDRRIDAGELAVQAAPASDLRARLEPNDNLSQADAAVLALAAATDGTAVMDEQYGRDVADAEGIATTGTAALVLDAVASNDIDAATGRDVIDAMIDAGWYCSPRLYTKLIRKLETLAD